MKATPYTVHAPYATHYAPVTVYAYDTDSALRKGSAHFPSGVYIVAKKN